VKNYFKFLILFIAFIFAGCSYHSNFDQTSILEGTGVTLQNHGTTIVVNPPSETETALVFYPGAYVNYDAYLPLMVKIAQKGIKCFIVQMPADLSILQIKNADYLPLDYPEINNWYIGGHSLGGAMASTYVADNLDIYKGLVLLAAYSTSDLSSSDLKVISIYGSNDGVLKKDKYDKYKSNLPDTVIEKVIEGGNHGNFGEYGFQKGDKEATIDSEVQKQLTADYVGEFCK